MRRTGPREKRKSPQLMHALAGSEELSRPNYRSEGHLMMTFTDRAANITATAALIAKLKGAWREATVLENARASMIETGYDNWNEGTSFFTLMLEVPIPTYAAIDNDRDELEQSILHRVQMIARGEIGNRITEIVISPILADAERPVEPAPVDNRASEDIPSFWRPGFFRLFLSHVAKNKASAHGLKMALAPFQIATFVAHDDIEPTAEWQAEIERALRTMDALCAIVDPGFRESRWCDQEVGIAMGRGKLVVPLCAGADPHGFLGKYQGIPAVEVKPAALAERIVETLSQNVLSAPRMSESLVDRLEAAGSWESAKRTISLLERVPRLNASQIARLVKACEENSEVRDAFGVPERIKALVVRLGAA